MPHADPDQERAKRRVLPGVGEGDGVDRGPLDAARIKELVDFCAYLEPGVCDRVAVDGAHRADVALRLGTLALRPGRAGLVDARRPARQAEKVFMSGGIMVSETVVAQFLYAENERRLISRLSGWQSARCTLYKGLSWALGVRAACPGRTR